MSAVPGSGIPDGKFREITSTSGTLYALDISGRVWKYTPARGNNFAFWSRLTDYRLVPEEKKS